MVGNGSPEGVVTAIPGGTYRNLLGGAGTTFWLKESGIGNTGWVAVDNPAVDLAAFDTRLDTTEADVDALQAADGVLGSRLDAVEANSWVSTLRIAADAVTFAKIQNITSDRLLGRDTAGSGDVEEL